MIKIISSLYKTYFHESPLFWLVLVSLPFGPYLIHTTLHSPAFSDWQHSDVGSEIQAIIDVNKLGYPRGKEE